MTKTSPCTAKKPHAFSKAPRCGAKARTNNYMPCRNPTVRGKSKCRMHGGTKGSGAQQGNTNALKHGLFTNQTKLFKKIVNQALKTIRTLDT